MALLSQNAIARLRYFSLWFSFIHALQVLVMVPIAIHSQVLTDDTGKSPLLSDALASGSYDVMANWYDNMAARVMNLQPNGYHIWISGFAALYYGLDTLLTVSDNNDDNEIERQSCRSLMHSRAVLLYSEA